MGESTYLWVASHALARLDALFSFSDPDAQTTRCFRSSCEALYRERIEASGVGSSLFASEGDFSRFKQGSRILHISCFTHNLHYALPWSLHFALYSMEGLKGSRRFSATFLESRLGPSVCGEVLLL
jgi:hypothetical protein